jgi:hypothetical protein
MLPTIDPFRYNPVTGMLDTSGTTNFFLIPAKTEITPVSLFY